MNQFLATFVKYPWTQLDKDIRPVLFGSCRNATPSQGVVAVSVGTLPAVPVFSDKM